MTHEFSPEGGGIAHRDDFGNYEANLRFLTAAGVPGVERCVLEVGPGKGRLLHHLHATCPRAVGLELDSRMIAESRRLFGRLPVIQGTGERLPFADGAFDVVIGFDVFEHVPHPDRFLAEARRVLKPGGALLVQTPNKWLNVLFETLRYRSLTAWRVDHCSLHSYLQLRVRMARHGFAPEFFAIPVVDEWFRRKVRAVVGAPGLWALRVLQPDRWPQFLRTNFYVRGRKT